MLSQRAKEKLVSFLEEDISFGDVTASAINEVKCSAVIIVREDARVAGLEEAAFLFEHLGARARALRREGAGIKKGATVMLLSGSNRAIVQAERTALNILGRMSGICTESARAKSTVERHGVRIALTRKTAPGLNEFDKKAAALAGIDTHRFNLSDMVLLKSNHLKFYKGISTAIESVAARKSFSKKLGVEAKTLKEAMEAAASKADHILLDNFSVQGAAKAVQAVRKKGRQTIELSGGINFSNLEEYARAKPDIISLGLLTHSVKCIDFSLEVRGRK